MDKFWVEHEEEEIGVTAETFDGGILAMRTMRAEGLDGNLSLCTEGERFPVAHLRAGEKAVQGTWGRTS